MEARRKYVYFYSKIRINIGGIKKMAKSDCKYAGDENSDGLVWCTKKNIYVSAKEKDTCTDYEKE